MSLTTVQVSIEVDKIVGTALAAGRVTFELTRPDIDGAIVVPQSSSVTLDSSGQATHSLWPNAAGTQGSQYRVTIYDSSGNLQFSGLATVPATACNLHDVLNLQAPAVVDDAQAAALVAQAYAAQARSVSGALLYTFDAATTDADPGAGKLRLNNATLASVTAAYVDNTEHGGADVSAVLDILDDSTSTNKATLILREGSTGKVAAYRVTGSVVDGTGYRKLTLVWVGGSTGGFTDTYSIGFTFSISGDAGSATGSNKQVMFNDGGVIAGNANFTWDKATNTLTVAGTSNPTTLKLGALGDAVLERGAANVIEQRNGASAQTFRVFDAYTDPTTNRRASAGWASNIFTITTEGVGSFNAGNGLRLIAGAGATLGLGAGGSNQWTINTSGHLLAASDNTYDIGASGATRPRTGYFGTSVVAPVHQFPATQVPSADPNALDDYEEGTFTPTLTFGGASVGVTYTYQVGTYTKIGNAVHFKVAIFTSAKGSSVGSAMVSGLPFTANSLANGHAVVSVYANGFSGLSGHVQGYVGAGTAIVTLTFSGTGSASFITDANCTATTQIMVAGTYFV